MTEERIEAGRQGEEMIVQHLVEKGCSILDRNVRYKTGEIDIIADDDGVLCFVEVRTREDTELGHPAETVTGQKKNRIRRAAQMYLMKNRIDDRAMRFDVATIIWNPRPDEEMLEYFENAF